MRAVICIAVTLALFFSVVCSKQINARILLIVGKGDNADQSAAITADFARDALKGPNIPVITLECSYSYNCSSLFQELISPTIVPFYGVVWASTAPRFFADTDKFKFYSEVHRFCLQHGLKVVVLSSLEPFMRDSVIFNVGTSEPFQSVRSVYPAKVIYSGHWQGTLCSSATSTMIQSNACVPGSKQSMTLQIASEVHGSLCGPNAGQSSIPCNLQSQTVNAIFFFPLIKNPLFQGTFIPVIVSPWDTGFTWFGHQATDTPNIVLAAITGFRVFGPTNVNTDTVPTEQLDFHFGQASFDFQSKLFVPIWVNYLTNNIFLGDRRVYLTPQIDDFLFSTTFRDELPDIFPEVGSDVSLESRTTGEKKWPYRTSIFDLESLVSWQKKFRSSLPLGSDFTIEQAINGQGTPARTWNSMPREFLETIGAKKPNPFAPENYIYDTLYNYLVKGTTEEGTSPMLEFYWVTHTWAHLSLTCNDFPDFIDETIPAYINNRDTAPQIQYNKQYTSTFRLETSSAESKEAYDKNRSFMDELFKVIDSDIEIQKLWVSYDSMVPPKISGMYNQYALEEQLKAGIYNVVGDNTRNGVNGATSTERSEYAPAKCKVSETQPDKYWKRVDNLVNSNPYHGVYTTTDIAAGLYPHFPFAGQFIIPRFATEIYFDASTDEENQWMYNYVVYKNPCTDCARPDWREILRREATRVTTNLLGLRHDAYMFHQANLRFFYVDPARSTALFPINTPIGSKPWISTKKEIPHSCLTCLFCESVYGLYKQHSTLPLATLRQSELAKLFRERTNTDLYCDVSAILTVTDDLVNSRVTDILVQVNRKKTADGVVVAPHTFQPPGAANSFNGKCKVSFSGTRASSAPNLPSDIKFLVSELDDSLIPRKNPLNPTIYRTIFGSERSFYLEFPYADGNSVSVKPETERFFPWSLADVDKVTLLDNSTSASIDNKKIRLVGNKFSFKLVNGAVTSAVLSVCRPKSPFTCDVCTDTIWELQPGQVKVGTITIPSGTVSGYYEQTFSFSVGSRILEFTLVKVVDNPLVSLKVGLVLIGPSTTINIGSTTSYNSKSKTVEVLGGVNLTPTVIFLDSAKSIAITASKVGNNILLVCSGKIYGTFTAQLVLKGTNTYIERTVTCTVSKPNVPLYIKYKNVRYDRVDMPSLSLSDTKQKTFKVCNEGTTNQAVEAMFGGTQYGESRRSVRHTEDEYVECITDEPTFSVTPTKSVVIKPNSCATFTVTASTVGQTINLSCSNGFFEKSLSILNRNNEHQPNVIVDVMVNVINTATTVSGGATSKATSSVTTSSTRDLSGSTKVSTIFTTRFSALGLPADKPDLINYNGAESVVSLSSLNFYVIEPGSEYPVSRPFTFDPSVSCKVEAEIKCLRQGAGKIIVHVPTDSAETPSLQFNIDFKCVDDTRYCTTFFDSGYDGLSFRTLGPQSNFELLGLGVCATCNKVQFFVAGSMNPDVGEAYSYTSDGFIGYGDAIFNIMKCPSWDVDSQCRTPSSSISLGQGRLYRFYSKVGSQEYHATAELVFKSISSGANFDVILRDYSVGCNNSLSHFLARFPSPVTGANVAASPNGEMCITGTSACDDKPAPGTFLGDSKKKLFTFNMPSENTATVNIQCPSVRFTCSDGEAITVSGCTLEPIYNADPENVIALHWFKGKSDSGSGAEPFGIHKLVSVKSVTSQNSGFSTFASYMNQVSSSGGQATFWGIQDNMNFMEYFTYQKTGTHQLRTSIGQSTFIDGFPLTEITDVNALQPEFRELWQVPERSSATQLISQRANFRWKSFEFDRGAFPEQPLEFMLSQTLECGNDFTGLFGKMPGRCRPAEQKCISCCRKVSGSVLIAQCGGDDCIYTSPGLFTYQSFVEGTFRLTSGQFSGVSAHPQTGELYSVERYPITSSGAELSFRLFKLNPDLAPVVITSLNCGSDLSPHAEVLDVAFNPCNARLWFSVRDIGLFSVDVTNVENPRLEYAAANQVTEFVWEALAFSDTGATLAAVQNNGEDHGTEPASVLYVWDLFTDSKPALKCEDLDLPASIRGLQFTSFDNRLLAFYPNSDSLESKDIMFSDHIQLNNDDTCTRSLFQKLDASITKITSVSTIQKCGDCNPPEPECVDGFYYDTTEKLCQPCADTCTTCSDAQKCVTCPSKCWLDGNNGCDWCPDECLECTSPDKCTQCPRGRSLVDGKCDECNSSCLTCENGNPGKCTECPAGRFLSDGTCSSCSESCGQCHGEPDCCTSCPTDYVLVKRGNTQRCEPRDLCVDPLEPNLATSECVCPKNTYYVVNELDPEKFICSERPPFHNCAGVRLATLDGQRPTTSVFDKPGHDYIPLPTTGPGQKSIWKIAPNSLIYRECLSCHSWGTTCLVFEDGTSFTSDGIRCTEENMLDIFEQNGVKKYRVKDQRAGFKIVIIQKVDLEDASFTPPLLSVLSGGLKRWRQYVDGFRFESDFTDSTNLNGIISAKPLSRGQAGAYYVINSGLPNLFQKGFRFCAESVMIYEDGTPIPSIQSANIRHRYSVNVDVLYYSGADFADTNGPTGPPNPQFLPKHVCPSFGYFSAFPRNVPIPRSQVTKEHWNRRCVDVRPRLPDQVSSISITLLFDPCDASAPLPEGRVECVYGSASALFRNPEILELDENLLGNSQFDIPEFLFTGFSGGIWRSRIGIPTAAMVHAGSGIDGSNSMKIGLLECPSTFEGETIDCSKGIDGLVQQIIFFDDPTRNTQTTPDCIVYPGGKQRIETPGQLWPKAFYVSGCAREEIVEGYVGAPFESSASFSMYIDFKLKTYQTSPTDLPDTTGEQWAYGYFVPFQAQNKEWHCVEQIIYAPEEVAALHFNLVYRDRPYGSNAYFDNLRVVALENGVCTGVGPSSEPGECFGDPHILTLDGDSYDMMTEGEYILTTDTALGQSDGIEVQVRTTGIAPTVAGGKVIASLNSGVAIRSFGKKILSVISQKTNPSNLWPHIKIYNDLQTPIADPSSPTAAQDQNGRVLHVFGDGLYLTDILKHDARLLQLVDKNKKYRVDIEIRRTDVSQYLRVNVRYPDSKKGHIRGLLGNWDGVKGNDFKTQDGLRTFTKAELKDQNILNKEFIDSWRIKSDTLSAFFYTGVENPDSFYNPNIPGGAFDINSFDQARRDEARGLCQQQGLSGDILEACVIDSLSLGTTPGAFLFVMNDNPNVPGAVETSCKSSCKTCYKDGNNVVRGTLCETCPVSYPVRLRIEDINGILVSECVQDCPAGYYRSTQNNIEVCLRCDSSCSSCTGPSSSECASCPGLKVLSLQKTCIDGCPDGQFISNRQQLRVCAVCDANCATCVDSKNGCTSCPATDGIRTFYLHRTTCVEKCPQGTFIDGTLCTQCSPGRSECAVQCENDIDRVYPTATRCYSVDDSQFRNPNAQVAAVTGPLVRAPPFSVVDTDNLNHRITLQAKLKFKLISNSILAEGLFGIWLPNFPQPIDFEFFPVNDNIEPIISISFLISGGTELPANKLLLSEAYLVRAMPDNEKFDRFNPFSTTVKFTWIIVETSEPVTQDEVKIDPKLG